MNLKAQSNKEARVRVPLIKKWKSYIPEKLPQGMKEFNLWVDDISLLSGLPINDKLKKVIGTLILQLPPSVASVPKNHIANLVKKAAANQVSVEVLQLINEKEKAENKEPQAVN
jgi:hypothetical protein